jgi:hypothetical protein
MKTNQIIQRPIYGITVNQRTCDEYFQLSTIENVATVMRLQHGRAAFVPRLFLEQKGTKEFLDALEKRTGKPAVISTGRGRGHHTWVHPYVMLEILLTISPELKVEAYAWLFDELIKYRGVSGDSYKTMCGSLYSKFKDPRKFQAFIMDSAKSIQSACGADDWNNATEQQLKLRDRIHDTIAIMADVTGDPRNAVTLGTARAKGEFAKITLSSADAQRDARPL